VQVLPVMYRNLLRLLIRPSTVLLLSSDCLERILESVERVVLIGAFAKKITSCIRDMRPVSFIETEGVLGLARVPLTIPAIAVLFENDSISIYIYLFVVRMAVHIYLNQGLFCFTFELRMAREPGWAGGVVVCPGRFGETF
jgi:hypothetical protein